MSQLIVGDYIEHWENGIGKITDANEESVILNFKKGNQDIAFPKEKTSYFKKLNPAGLYAKLYEDRGYIEDLIWQESTEIIKLLIINEAVGDQKKLEISRIKSLLMIGGQAERGWRKDFGLIKESDWKKWWQNVSQNISNDPWFDTSLKPFIILREQPISAIQNIYDQFVAEKVVPKKLLLTEKLIDMCDIDKDAHVLQIIKDFIADIVITSSDEEIFHISIYNAILLTNKGIVLKPFNDRAYELSFKSLVKSALPSLNLEVIYTFFSALPIRNINDHVLIFISVDNKTRKVIAKYLQSKEYSQKLLEGTKPEQSLTELQIEALNHLAVIKRKEIYGGLIGYTKLFGNQYISKLIIDILLMREIGIGIQDIFAGFVLKYNMTNVVYSYFKKIVINKDQNIPFLPDFLRLIGSENAEIVYRQILMSEEALSERPSVFLAALKSISTGSSIIFNNMQIRSIMSHLNDILANSKIPMNGDLKLEISRMMANTQTSGEVKISYDMRELSNIVKMKLFKLDKRAKALTLLINKGLKDECIDLSNDIIVGIGEDDFVILENIYKAFPDEKLAKQLFVSIIKQISASQEELITSLQRFIINSNMLRVFFELILIDKDDAWFEANSEKIFHLMNEEKISSFVISIGLREHFLKAKCSPNITKRLPIICARHTAQLLDEMQNIYFKAQEDFGKKSQNIKDDFIGQINRSADEHESQRLDAINKTSQRYEEYLKKIIPHLHELEILRARLEEGSVLKDISTIQSELISKLTIIKQDIEGTLKILGIIERD